MSYIDHAFYSESFGGKEIPASEFDRLAEIASDIIYDVCNKKPTEKEVYYAPFKKAVCYQTELLYEQGGVDAILGFSEASQKATSESLGGYSISTGSSSQEAVKTINGVPISTLALMTLRRLGLMSRWAYAEVYERRNRYGEQKDAD